MFALVLLELFAEVAIGWRVEIQQGSQLHKVVRATSAIGARSLESQQLSFEHGVDSASNISGLLQTERHLPSEFYQQVLAANISDLKRVAGHSIIGPWKRADWRRKEWAGKLESAYVRQLGKGAFGIVFWGKIACNQADVAVKIQHRVCEKGAFWNGLGFETKGRRECRQAFEKGCIEEVRAMEMFRSSDRFVSLFDHGSGPPGEDAKNTQYSIMMEKGSGTLSDFTKPGKHRYDFRQLTLLLYEIFDGLSVMHDRHALHRDIKPDNILYTCPPEGHQGYCHAMVADLGLACSSQQPSALPPCDQFGGTPLYLPPELHLDGLQNEKGDVWAVGVMAHEMFLACLPGFIANAPDIEQLYSNVADAPDPSTYLVHRFRDDKECHSRSRRSCVRHLIQAMLEPRERYRENARYFRDALAVILDEYGVPSSLRRRPVPRLPNCFHGRHSDFGTSHVMDHEMFQRPSAPAAQIVNEELDCPLMCTQPGMCDVNRFTCKHCDRSLCKPASNSSRVGNLFFFGSGGMPDCESWCKSSSDCGYKQCGGCLAFCLQGEYSFNSFIARPSCNLEEIRNGTFWIEGASYDVNMQSLTEIEVSIHVKLPGGPNIGVALIDNLDCKYDRSNRETQCNPVTYTYGSHTMPRLQFRRTLSLALVPSQEYAAAPWLHVEETDHDYPECAFSAWFHKDNDDASD